MANQQIQAMGQELDQLHGMLKTVSESMEAQKLRIEEYNAETKRIQAVQAGMTPEQVQEIVVITLRDVMEQSVPMPQMPEMQPPMEQLPLDMGMPQ
jgi:phage shock protein A